MKATVKYVEQKFAEFNNLIFMGKLPKLPIKLSSAKSYLGLCLYNKRRTAGGKVEYFNFRLRINNKIDLPQAEIDDIIIHEMIHYCIAVNNLKDTSSHGQVFKQFMNTINARFGRNIKISHKLTAEQRAQLQDTKRRWHVIAVVDLTDGRCGIKVLPRVTPKIITYYNIVGSNEKVKKIKLYISDEPYFNRFPTSAALNIAFVNKSEVTEYLKNAATLKCNGKKLLF